MERTAESDRSTDGSTVQRAGQPASLAFLKDDPQQVRLQLSGRLDVHTVGGLWQEATDGIRASACPRITLDASALSSFDGAGAGFLTYLSHVARQCGKELRIVGLAGPWQSLVLSGDQPRSLSRPTTARARPVELVGSKVAAAAADLYAQVAFLGRICEAAVRQAREFRRFRWPDFLMVIELGGVNAVGVVAMLGFLFGLIMAFSSAMPLRRFGVEIYVSDLVAIALVRVLGPFLTAVILTGRTGSAYAAEIGTMKINNELDALEVMAIDPVRFLVVPRVLALTLVTPLLATITNLVGLAGCAIVILSLGYPLATYWAHVRDILSAGDVVVGLVKALVFGGLVGTIGCLRGLQTQSGPGAVGQATTRAVVSSLVALVLAEGGFAVLLYLLDI
jgi:phospholipid/cholesterol/gamma-HCH transport system permease protein